jgi:t-SNARE complex subunit (syntaxin)
LDNYSVRLYLFCRIAPPTSQATQILEEKRRAKIEKIKNYMIFIALIVIVLAAVLYYFSE